MLLGDDLFPLKFFFGGGELILRVWSSDTALFGLNLVKDGVTCYQNLICSLIALVGGDIPGV